MNEDYFLNFDPDVNILNNAFNSDVSQPHSEYFTVDQFNSVYSQYSCGFSILNFNIRSYNRNFDNFSCFLGSLNKLPDVFSLSETWLNTDSLLPSNYQNYKVFNTVRFSGRGGGVSVFVDKSYCAYKVQNLSLINNFIETCCVKLTLGNFFQLFIISVYRPPKSNVLSFVHSLIEILNSPTLNKAKIVLMGDFNLDLMKHDNLSKQYKLELESLGFLLFIL